MMLGHEIRNIEINRPNHSGNSKLRIPGSQDDTKFKMPLAARNETGLAHASTNANIAIFEVRRGLGSTDFRRYGSVGSPVA